MDCNEARPSFNPVCAFQAPQSMQTLSPMNAPDTWRERARARMKEIGLTQERLSEQFEMTPAAMQKWLAGTRQPSFEEINKIAECIGVTQTWLTYGLDPNDTTEGLSEGARTMVRNLIKLERSRQLPQSLVDAIGAMVNAVVPYAQEGDNIKSSADSEKTGTDG